MIISYDSSRRHELLTTILTVVLTTRGPSMGTKKSCPVPPKVDRKMTPDASPFFADGGCAAMNL